ncbi:MAG: methylated-DNA--[protein]-cysteine S-methyltransferase [Balneolaceae bacterium]|nr:methylated-DNA--[protein]-cysteine S-methyltransferase [Balneolaceae bacterium]
MNDFDRIARALTYISDHYTEQPDLREVAEQVHLSPYHFHRLFSEWAGVTPKTFLQYVSLNHAKSLLEKRSTIESATYHTGFSSSSRLHDLFVKIEGMTPGEFKNAGEGLAIRYDLYESPFGRIFIAGTGKGICNMGFVGDASEAEDELSSQWPNATLIREKHSDHENAARIFTDDWTDLSVVKLHLKGTDFQVKVWETLLKIPFGMVCSYSELAKEIGRPKASRAVGSAVARNPIAYLIPCHRVIRQLGEIGQYRWGTIRKRAIVGWESGRTYGEYS